MAGQLFGRGHPSADQEPLNIIVSHHWVYCVDTLLLEDGESCARGVGWRFIHWGLQKMETRCPGLHADVTGLVQDNVAYMSKACRVYCQRVASPDRVLSGAWRTSSTCLPEYSRKFSAATVDWPGVWGHLSWDLGGMIGRGTSTPQPHPPPPCVEGYGTPYPKAHQP